MKTYHRDFIYENDDFNTLCKFIVKDNSIKKDYFIWNISRIADWKYNLINKKNNLFFNIFPV
jgi:hypothetical protein